MSLDPLTYPRPRPRGAVVSLGAEGEPIPLPRMRLFPFILNIVASRRTTVSGPRCIGPGIIRKVFVRETTGQGSAVRTYEIGYATSQVNEASALLTSARPYTVLTELQDPFDVQADAGGRGYPASTNFLASARLPDDVNLIVDAREFFPVFAVVNNNVNAEEVSGFMHVLENVSREALANFL